MTQDVQHLKSEIIANLDRLPPDSLSLLAKFVTFLRSTSAQPEISKIDKSIPVKIPTKSLRMTSPRLVHRDQAVDFRKEIVETETNDSI